MKLAYQNLERALLGHFLQKPETFAQTPLTPSDFSHSFYAELFRMMKDLEKQKLSFNRASFPYEEDIPAAYLPHACADGDVESFTKVLKEASQRRALAKCLGMEKEQAEQISLEEMEAILRHKHAEEAKLLNKHETQRQLVKVSADSLLAMAIPPRAFLLEPIIQEKDLVMVHAWRGLGKTRFSLGIAAACAYGGAFLKWRAPKPCGVLYVDGELAVEDLQKWVRECVSDLPLGGRLELITPDLQTLGGIPSLATAEGQALVEKHLDGINLVVFDNLSTLFRIPEGQNGDAEWLPVQDWLLSLRTRGIAALIVHHDGKGKQQRGTSLREDILNLVLHLKRPENYKPEEGLRLEVHFSKGRVTYGEAAKAFEATMSSQDGVQVWAMKGIGDSTGQTGDVLERARARIQAGESLSKVADSLGILKGTLSKKLKRLSEPAGDENAF